jgi:hypothetical protein
MRHYLFALLLALAATGCAADTSEPVDLGVDTEALITTTVNNATALNNATPLAVAIGICEGMQWQSTYFVCTGDANTATCDWAFGAQPPTTHWVVGNCTNFAGNYPVPNPPGGTLAAQKNCQSITGTITSGSTGGLANQSWTLISRFGTFVCKPGIHKLWI